MQLNVVDFVCFNFRISHGENRGHLLKTNLFQTDIKLQNDQRVLGS